jgi:hypothetical protein
LFPAEIPSPLLPPQEERKTAEVPLLFRSSQRRQPRVSAENQLLTADNSPQKQQKQREAAEF